MAEVSDQQASLRRPMVRRLLRIVLFPVTAVTAAYRGLRWLGGGMLGTNEHASWKLKFSFPLEIARLGMTLLLIVYVLEAENVFNLLGPGFVSIAALALLCFTYVQALRGDSEERLKVLVVGRRFMLAAALVLILVPLVLMMDGVFSWTSGTGASGARHWLAYTAFSLFVGPTALVTVTLVSDGVVELVRTLLPAPAQEVDLLAAKTGSSPGTLPTESDVAPTDKGTA